MNGKLKWDWSQSLAKHLREATGSTLVPDISGSLGVSRKDHGGSSTDDEVALLRDENAQLKQLLKQRNDHGRQVKHRQAGDVRQLQETRRILLDALQLTAINEKRLRQALEIASIGTWHLDLQNRSIRWSDEIYRLFGIDKSCPLTLEKIFDYTHPEDRSKVAQAWESALQGGYFNCDYRVVINAETRWVHASAQIQFSADRQAQSALGIIQNISLIKTREHENSRLLSIQDAILRNEAVGFAILRERKFVWVNPTIARLWGYQPEELIGQSIRCLYPDQSSFEQIGAEAYACIERGEVFKAQLPFVHKDGHHGWVDVTGARLDPGNQTSLWSYVDISEEKEFESELVSARLAAEIASRAKSEFLANMSHEIRTPLNAVTGMVHLLRDTALDQQQQQYLRNIEAASGVLLGVINDILDYSKIEAGRLEISAAPFDLSQVFHALSVIANTAAKNKDIDVLFRIAPNVPHELIGDSLRLKQILINLTNNAIKFTHQGHVVVHVELEELSPSHAALRFDVEDSGIGISEAQQQQLFRPFVQAESSTSRRYGGTGLGLAISRRLAEMMGGRLELRSQPGVGSTFSLSLRLPRQHAEDRPWVIVPEHLQHLRLLIVDPNERSRTVTFDIARSLHWHVVALAGADEAIERLEEAMFRGQSFDLCLLATQQAEPARQLVHRLRDEIPEELQPRIILLASQPEGSLISEFREAVRIAGVLLKPFTPSTLFETVSPFFLVGQKEAGGDHEAHDDYHGQARILVAEDNELNQILISELLSRRGLAACIAADGEECLLQLESNPDGFDLVLMDMQMPGIDGLEATRRLRADPRFAELPVVALTANAQQQDHDACLAAGMNDFLTKPIDPRQLEQMLHSFLAHLLPESLSVQAQPNSPETPANDQINPGPAPHLDTVEALRKMDGDKGLYREILFAFEQSYRNFCDRVRRLGHSEEDRLIANRLAHTACGLARTIGANLLADRIHRLETTSAEDAELNLVELSPLLNEIDEELLTVLNEIQSYRTGNSEPSAS